MNYEMWILNNSVTAQLLRSSPFRAHRQVYQECVLARGGFFQSAVPPGWVIGKFVAGEAVGVAAHDLMPAFR